MKAGTGRIVACDVARYVAGSALVVASASAVNQFNIVAKRLQRGPGLREDLNLVVFQPLKTCIRRSIDRRDMKRAPTAQSTSPAK